MADARGSTAQGWEGEAGRAWVRDQARHDAVFAVFNDPILDGARVGPGARVLDIGCGCGASTLAAAARGARALGVDLSSAMLAHAAELAARRGQAGARFLQAAAQRHPFEEGGFDAVISRFGVMFFDDPAAAFRNIAAALRPGGRMSFTCLQRPERNPHITFPAQVLAEELPGAPAPQVPAAPFSMADSGLVRGLLEEAGFREVTIEALVQDLRVGDSAAEAAARYLSQPMPQQVLARLPRAEALAATERVRARLAEHERGDGLYLGSAVWLATATR